MENKNIRTILEQLADSLQQNDSLPQLYLDSQHITNEAALDNPSPADPLRRQEGKLPEFLQQYGIRSMTLQDTGNISTLLATATYMAYQIGGSPRNYFRNASFIGYLQALFQHSSTIAFTDWAIFANASDYWDTLFTEVIKPLKTKEREFIFYLGNIADRPVFMVDEMLDIMGDFARHGRVTFIMDQEEMKNLWQAFHGMSTAKGDLWPFDNEDKYKSLFGTLNVHRLIVYAHNGVSLYSKEKQFNLTRRIVPTHIEKGATSRNDFINGYSLGLSWQLDIALCLALGIAWFELKGQKNAMPGRQELLNYIIAWKDQQDAITA